MKKKWLNYNDLIAQDYFEKYGPDLWAEKYLEYMSQISKRKELGTTRLKNGWITNEPVDDSDFEMSLLMGREYIPKDYKGGTQNHLGELYKEEPKRGLGDIVEAFLRMTGIKWFYHKFIKSEEDCGCEKRKKKLNNYGKGNNS